MPTFIQFKQTKFKSIFRFFISPKVSSGPCSRDPQAHTIPTAVCVSVCDGHFAYTDSPDEMKHLMTLKTISFY